MNDSEPLFFKYFSISDKNDKTHPSKHLNEKKMRSLRDNELLFSSPLHFNDPFDSILDIYYEGTIEDWLWFHGDEFTDEMFEYFIHHLVETEDGTHFRLVKDKQSNEILNPYQNTTRILCLTQKNDDILMWSHYADNHRGICLCFKAIRQNDTLGFYFDSEFFPLYEIKYRDETPSPVNFFDFDMKGTIQFLTTKHSSWQYEKEYRIIGLNRNLNDDKSNFKKFDKSSLVGVIFGLRTPHEHIESVYRLIEKYYIDEGYDIRFYKCRRVQGNYAVKPEEINIKTYLSSND